MTIQADYILECQDSTYVKDNTGRIFWMYTERQFFKRLDFLLSFRKNATSDIISSALRLDSSIKR